MQTSTVALNNFSTVRELRTKISTLKASALLTGKFTVAKEVADGKKKAVKDGLELNDATVVEAKTQWFLVDQDGTQYWIRPLEIEGNATITMNYEEVAEAEEADDEFAETPEEADEDDEFIDEDEDEDEE